MAKRIEFSDRQRITEVEPRESFSELLGALLKEMGGLVRDEIALVKSEFRDRFRQYRSAILMIAAGGLLGLLACMTAVAALVLAITPLVGAVWAAVIVGVLLAAVSMFLFMSGMKQFRR